MSTVLFRAVGNGSRAKFHHNIPLGSRDRAIFTSGTTQAHSFVEISHEIISKTILSLPLIQEGQLSVISKASTDDKCHFAISWFIERFQAV